MSALALAWGLVALPLAALTSSATRNYRIEVSVTGTPPVALYAEETGHGAPILLLHGLGESTFTWRNVVPGLSLSHRVIALDLKGFGRSEKPLDQAYSADDQAALVAQFIAKRGLTAVTLVGHSFGGTVALHTALLPGMRDRIARLILISAPGFPHSTASYLDLVDVPAIPETLAVSMPPEILARALLSEGRGGAGDIPEEEIRGYAAPYYEFSAKRAFLVTARSIVSEAESGIANRYRTILQPSLVIWCRNDPIVPLKTGKRLARTLPNARLAVLEGCHHLPQDEKPAHLLALLRSFLEP
jgi:pimeloyl-ACP methyl ester carboxylesterase